MCAALWCQDSLASNPHYAYLGLLGLFIALPLILLAYVCYTYTLLSEGSLSLSSNPDNPDNPDNTLIPGEDDRLGLLTAVQDSRRKTPRDLDPENMHRNIYNSLCSSASSQQLHNYNNPTNHPGFSKTDTNNNHNSNNKTAAIPMNSNVTIHEFADIVGVREFSLDKVGSDEVTECFRLFDSENKGELSLNDIKELGRLGMYVYIYNILLYLITHGEI